MKIIPVIDVLNGIVVHGIRGERKKYQPLKSLLCNSCDPVAIAASFETLGFSSLYLADLDAIMDNSPNYATYTKISENTSLTLMVDAGISDINKAENVLQTGVSTIVVGSETLTSLDFVKNAVNKFGKNKVVVSIDQKNGKLLGASESVSSLDAVSFAKQLEALGVCQIILLELDRVGTEHGTNFSLMNAIQKTTKLEVIVGGGIRSIQEMENLRESGISRALVATVLHNGKVTVDDLRSANFL
jgi:phosphoribosylformimino-5-aminoimidazole carboxamide ribotide isomerase